MVAPVMPTTSPSRKNSSTSRAIGRRVFVPLSLRPPLIWSSSVQRVAVFFCALRFGGGVIVALWGLGPSCPFVPHS